jgi:hypothetical protein
VQPSHGLNHDEVERLVLESVEHARADFNTRRFIELKNKTDADQKEITSHIKSYGQALTHDKLPQLDEKLAGVEKVIADYKGKDIPGVGPGAAYVPGFMRSQAAIDARAPITALRNMITVSEAGLSQTAAEMRNVLQGMGLSPDSTDEAFIAAIPILRDTLETRKRTVAATYRPEAVEEFHRRTGAAGGKTIVKELVKDGKRYVKYSDGSEGVLP